MFVSLKTRRKKTLKTRPSPKFASGDRNFQGKWLKEIRKGLGGGALFWTTLSDTYFHFLNN